MSDKYYFSMYRGRIILKSLDQHYQLERYRSRPGIIFLVHLRGWS